MDDCVTCLVRGPGSRYPRGFLLLIPCWFVILAGICLLLTRHFSSLRQPPLWFEASEVAGLFVAACLAFFVVATSRHRAFRADADGIRLGVAGRRRRPKLRHVSYAWPDVASVGLIRRRYGGLAEVTLRPTAGVAHRSSLWRQAGLLSCMLLLPFWLGRGYPALTRPRRLSPVRYRFRICAADASAVVIAVAAVAPASVAVRLVNSRSALRYLAPPAMVRPAAVAPPATIGAPAVLPPAEAVPAAAVAPEPPAVHA